ncbi:hypothetical protein CRYUN_Cryun39dG0014500 [Craigia yunnanensis]
MEGEFKNFFKVWILAITSLCYCYYISDSPKESRKAAIPPPYNLSIIHPPFQPFHCPFLRHHRLLPCMASQFQAPPLPIWSRPFISISS